MNPYQLSDYKRTDKKKSRTFNERPAAGSFDENEGLAHNTHLQRGADHVSCMPFDGGHVEDNDKEAALGTSDPSCEIDASGRLLPQESDRRMPTCRGKSAFLPTESTSNNMTSPDGHVQPDGYMPSSQSSQFVLNDYETPVHRILLSDNPSSSNTPSAPQHTQGVGTLVVLPAPQETPSYLDNLLNPNNGSSSKKFRREIRAYNSMFAFTSMGAVVDNSVNSRPGSYVFKVNAYCHHVMGSLLPMDNKGPKFAQLYIFDTDNEVSNRLQPFCNENFQSSLDSDIVVGLINMLDSSNQLVRLFRHARQRLGDVEVPELKLRLIGKRDDDSRQYDDPSLNDIGGLVVGDIGHCRSDRDIIIESLSGTLQRISKLHPKFMSLHYPLLFPYGEDGFHTDIPLAHQEQQPPKKRQKERLDFIRANQENLRSEHYKGIHDAIARGDTDGSTTGKIILPSSLTGSPRYMVNNYQDAMAICRCYGNPDLFITFTCNVNWPEIRREIKKTKGYQPEDKPDIIARVFHSKLIDMMSFIKSGKPFGRTIADVCAVEFQKRGLPHTHLLVWLAPEFKFRSPEDVDSIISAEIPDKHQDPICFEIVSKFMMHGPCGAANPKAQCMEKNKCSKQFPKKNKDATIFGENGFVYYKRRMQPMGHIVKNGISLSNCHVVPYNKELLLRYNAHINVEICCQSLLIKYLFKYVSKGADRCRMVMKKDTDDEIQAYLNCRFICPYEAVWRLFQFPIHSRSPAVERLQVHLPLQHHVFFSGNQSLSSVLGRPGINKTMLTEWFERNRVDVDARDLFYSQFPNKYVWDARQKEWIVRSRGFCLGRIVYVHPAAGELYFLRMLLNHVKGAKSFEDLRQISGTIFPTFQLACKALGLLGDDKEWSDAFGEAIPTASSPQLRQLFINIIMFCEVADPNSLFDQFWHSMHDDIEYHLRSSFSMLNVRLSDDELKNYVLYELEQLFNASGTSLEDHKLPMPNGRLMDEVRNKLLREELSYDLAELRNNHSLAMPLLNPCQRNIYDSVITSILQKKQALIFVHGHGGTGKTFLWHTIINRVRSEGSIVLAVASSGIASLLLPGGRTAHSRFKIPLEVNESSTCEIKHNTHLSRLLEMTSLIVWDEAPMNNRFCFEALDKSLRDVLRLNNPFGGKSVLLGGDFRQILPVIPGGTKEEIINASFTSSLLWSAFTFLTLNQNMRLSAEGLSPDQKDELRQFAEWILLIGDGQICDLAVSDDHDAAFIKIPCELQVEVIDSPIAAIVSAIYPDIERAHLDPFYFKDRAIVTPKNLTVSEINNFILDIIPGHKYNFLSCDSIQTTSGDIDNIDLLYPIEFINQLDFNGVPQHSISLKIGTPIMLLRNLSPSAGLCNGTRLIVTQLAERIIEAQIITGSNIGDRVFIPRIVFPVNDKKCPFTIKRRQFPIRPCYAMTINKSQGQSLKIVGVFLKEQVFSHGQLYVALSRVTSKNGLKIISLDHEGKPSCYAKNIVYKDIIQLLPKE
ncbi:uncharacterized protein [Populus alba]|uniref:uncharacterized protein n=1 Tax=Populus alba TaxID=43335 RepID=UPI003CC7086F